MSCLAGGSPSLLSVVLCFWPSLLLLSVFKIFFLFSSVLPELHSSQKQTLPSVFCSPPSSSLTFVLCSFSKILPPLGFLFFSFSPSVSAACFPLLSKKFLLPLLVSLSAQKIAPLLLVPPSSIYKQAVRDPPCSVPSWCRGGPSCLTSAG